MATNSDGGSSDYYKITIVRAKDGKAFDCEVGDIIYAVCGGDFDLGNIVKACRRAYLQSRGKGKEGVSIDYDMKKVGWFAQDFVARFGETQHEEEI